MNTLQGKKIEKNITYNEQSDTYFVQFNFRDCSHLKSFPTLEDARAYRDTVNAEKLRIKTQETLEGIRKHDKEEIYRSKDVYPYNALEAVGVSDSDVSPEIIEKFDELLSSSCNAREENTIHWFYRDGQTLGQIATICGLSRERIRQIIVKGLKKTKYTIRRYDSIKQEQERKVREQEAEAALQQKRDELICAFREHGIITEDITVYFGKPTFALDPVSPEERYVNSLTIDDLDLSVRSYNCLRRARIQKVSDLVKLTINDLYKVKNLGKKSAREICDKLAYNGLSLSEPNR